ncbi:MAG: hypothetical protein ACLGJC_33795 [Alphaproteobacteria bacterium]
MAGGAAAGALAGTMAMPGIGTVIGAIIGAIAGMVGTQKATVGKTASADVTIASNGKSATYGNVLTDNEGDQEVGKALGTALSGIFSIAALGGGTLTATTGASLTSLTAGQIVGVKVGASANSGAATLNVDGIGDTAVRKNGSALVGGELAASTDLWFQYDGTYFRLLGGSGSGAVSFPSAGQKTSSYPISAADAGKLFPCSGSWTLSLLAATSAGNGFSIAIKNNGSGSISVAPNGSDLIDTEPRRVCRRPHFLRGWGHHDETGITQIRP